jgi:hypothetical protein
VAISREEKAHIRSYALMEFQNQLGLYFFDSTNIQVRRELSVS